MTAASVQSAMEQYFAGEITGGYVLIAMGVAALVAVLVLRRSAGRTGRGAAYVLLALGVLELAAGIFIAVASSRRVDAFTPQIAKDPQAFVATEAPRMAKVSTQFTVLKVVELGLIAGGLGLAGIARRKRRPRLLGAGLALALQAGMILGFDVVAADRALTYRAALAGPAAS